jgi:creatinine amidohydrolase/Fe(II)-dependent formamide hydrolase-like protein
MNMHKRHLLDMYVRSGLGAYFPVNYHGANEEVIEVHMEKFAELIVQRCASIVRNADLDDVEGGDSAVLQAAADQLEKYFGIVQQG